MIQAFQNYLNARGINSSFLNKNTILTFELDSIHYVYIYDADEDPAYIKMMIPLIGQIPPDDQHNVRQLLDLSYSYKIGKAIVDNENNIWLIAESFVYTRDNLERLFDRLISVLRDMFNEYRHRSA